jgi:hypothetical protein
MRARNGLPVLSASGKPRVFSKFDLIGSSKQREYDVDARDIDDPAAMNSEKSAGIESLFQARQCLV